MATAAAEEATREELLRRLGDPTLTIVDVLGAASWAHEHIPGAVSLPLADIPTQARAVLPDLDAEIVTYCASASCPASAEAAARLRALGYTNVRHYPGGLAEWKAAGGPLAAAVAPAGRAVVPQRPSWGNAVLEALERLSTSELFALWLGMVVACAVVYWLAGAGGCGLLAGGVPVAATPAGLATALYFSFVTATSVGYGDVLPTGPLRALAVAEAAAGLLAFGAVVAKLVSRRQDELVREIHRVTFEERLDRVQTNLHLVLSELQAIAAHCGSETLRPERLAVRLESAALVFAGELRSIHDLLYRPHRMPEEPLLAAILAGLTAALRALGEVLACLPPTVGRSATLEDARRQMVALASDICGHCVPREPGPALMTWMDRVQEAARQLA
jgi:rhodanese-related sulfurtransferase